MAIRLEFEEALTLMKEGRKMRRHGWVSKLEWVSMLFPDNIIVADRGPGCKLYLNSTGQGMRISPCLLRRTALGVVELGWVPSPVDLMAKDWELF